MSNPRWIIMATGADDDTGEASHCIAELDPKTEVYSTVLQTFSLAYAHLVLEALCWQEDLQRGLAVEPHEAKPKPKIKRT